MPTYSYRRSFRLWRCLHMETINIWTHLLGSAGFVATGVILYQYTSTVRSLRLTTGDFFAFGTSITSAAVCFGLSATFHTLRSHSYHVHHLWGKMDILGICVLALGGGMSMTYYAFYCSPAIRRVYWAVNTLSAGAAAFTLFDTGGGGNKMRTLRGGVSARRSLQFADHLGYVASFPWCRFERVASRMQRVWRSLVSRGSPVSTTWCRVVYWEISGETQSWKLRYLGPFASAVSLLRSVRHRFPCRWTCDRVSISTSKSELLIRGPA